MDKSSDYGNSAKFPAVCSSCGQETTVPFQPVEGRPVYCLDCYRKQKDASGNSRGGNNNLEMHDAICSSCGEHTKVPFLPRPDKPVYCRECYNKNR